MAYAYLCAHVAGHDRPSGLRDCFHPSQVNEGRRGKAACPPFPYDELDNAYLLPGPEIPANSPRKAGSDMAPLLRMLQSRACCLGAPQRIRGRQPKKLRGGGVVEPPRRHPPDVVEPSRGALKLRERERRNSHGQNESGPERLEIPGQENERDHSSESANLRMKIPGNPNIEE